MGDVATSREVEMTEKSENVLYTGFIVIINKCLSFFSHLIKNAGLIDQLSTDVHTVKPRPQHTVAYVTFCHVQRALTITVDIE